MTADQLVTPKPPFHDNGILNNKPVMASDWEVYVGSSSATVIRDDSLFWPWNGAATTPPAPTYPSEGNSGLDPLLQGLHNTIPWRGPQAPQNQSPPQSPYLKDLDHTLGAIWHILVQSQQGVWTTTYLIPTLSLPCTNS